MSNPLYDIAKTVAKQEINAQPTGKYVNAKVLSVRQDYLRATVQFETGQTIENMLNKSGEILTVGQNVKVQYITTPSKGWISLANGEANPMGGGGGGVTVEYAPILSDLTAPDFTITREVMIQYSAKTNVLYGAVPAFIIVNGVYCYYGTINSQNGATVLQQLLQNRELFGNGFSMKCYSKDSDFGTSQIIHHVTEYVSERRNINPQTTTTVGYDKFSFNGTDYSHSFSFARAYNKTGIIQEYFLVPNVEIITNVENLSYLTNEQKAILIAAGIEYIPQNIKVLMFYKLNDVWACTDTNYRGDTLYGYSSSNYAIPVWSKDEMDFALGITKRTEPLED